MNRMSFINQRGLVAGFGLAAWLAFAGAGCGGGGSGASSGSPDMEHPIVHTVTPEDAATTKSKEPIKADSVVLWVNGMGCPLCASNIDRQLERLKGVQGVKVDLGQGVVTVSLKPGVEHPSPARLGDAVEDAGFTLVKVEKAAGGAGGAP